LYKESITFFAYYSNTESVKFTDICCVAFQKTRNVNFENTTGLWKAYGTYTL